MKATYRIPLKRFLNGSLCASICITAVVAGTASTVSAATDKSNELITYGKTFIGTPYLYGAIPYMTNAFDCSSFTQYVFDNFDITLPRTSSGQAAEGRKIDKKNLSVGDLVFFKTNGVSISHVAIYAGNNTILHSGNDGVELTDMSTSYWQKKYVTARRVLD